MAPEQHEQERLSFALEQSISASYIGISATLVLALAAALGTGAVAAAAWAVLMVSILVLRGWVLRRAVTRLGEPGGPAQANKDFTLSTVVLAFTIGSLPAIAFPGMTLELRMVVTVFLCLWCCAAMASLGLTPRLFTVYLLLVLGGLAVGWARTEMPGARYTAVAMVLYMVVLRAFSHNFTRRIVEGMAIRAENDALVRQLSAANEAKTRFIMAASHDLRQPLHAISYLGGVLARARDPADVRSANEALTAAVEGLNKLFSAILDLSRIDSGAVRMHPVSFKLDGLVAQLDSEYRTLCVASGRRWECQVEAATALTDPVLLERVLRNLLDNAMKHGGDGMVRLAVERRGDEVVITVSDNGPGIPLESRSRVFDEFYRGNETGPPGLGLGLSIVRRLVDRLGCRVVIDFTDAQTQSGAAISVHIPQGSALLEEATPALPGHGSADEEDVSGLAVLVIDDDATVLHATRALLVQWGCRVATCGRGDVLDEVVAGLGPLDVAVVDYRLDGGRNGLDLVEGVRDRHPGMGVVMVTGESDPQVLDQLAESGLPVLEKPVSPRDLRRTLALFKAADA
ncbi:hybrid sensor histidine kinase/response regulator [Ramlibacter sp. PS3R-8]|uniref:hybrid sensor histidine kinase/response regulator n=1 Tax=Ramlibacter sp. PS3R-8 TaxID=3133437 RepID=UPI0030AC1359